MTETSPIREVRRYIKANVDGHSVRLCSYAIRIKRAKDATKLTAAEGTVILVMGFLVHKTRAAS